MNHPTTTIGKFGTAPVFLTAISTILGAVMFLRFGFAVGQVGFWGTMGIILIGHAVTIPTAMAIAEIATNQKVEGGGEYFIISRSFGLVIGSTIGIALFFSQAISVAFYVMAFSEAFSALFDYFLTNYYLHPALEWLLTKKQIIGIPALLILTYIMLTKGADLGVKALYVVVLTLAISLVAFFLGSTEYSQTQPVNLVQSISNYEPEAPLVPDSLPQAYIEEAKPGTASQPDPLISIGFFTVFAIIFPAFTGMTAGVGLSGDLRNPGKSIPLGTLGGTLAGMVMYIFISYKLAISAPPDVLADTSRLVMADIAWQGWWIIPVGLAAATISSALGSIMVAPRTLQAIAKDRIFPTPRLNNWLSAGSGTNNEPFNASIITILIAAVFIMMGAIDNVARIISMFFMVSYGTISLISFFNHFSANPSYRPKFRSRWYFSLFGAVASFGLMFFMNPGYAFLAILLMLVLYFVVNYYNREKGSMAEIFQGVLFQLSRQTHVFLQNAEKEQIRHWRPSAIAISSNTFDRLGLFDLLRWIAHRYGFGTYIHFIKGYLSKETGTISKETQSRLIKLAESSKSNVIVDTLVSPSLTSTVAQVVQLPGIAGTENNLLLFEFSKENPNELSELITNFNLIQAAEFDSVILGTTDRGYGLKKQIHIWITRKDFANASLMILLAYIIMGHKDWRRCEIKILAIFPEEKVDDERQALLQLIREGQLPISPNNVQFLTGKDGGGIKTIIRSHSKDADLTILGFGSLMVKHHGQEVFEGYENIGNTLFVNAAGEKKIKKE